jgi:hypothetical protein
MQLNTDNILQCDDIILLNNDNILLKIKKSYRNIKTQLPGCFSILKI